MSRPERRGLWARLRERYARRPEPLPEAEQVQDEHLSQLAHADFVEEARSPAPPHYSALLLTAGALLFGGFIVAGHVLRSLGTAPTVSLSHASSGDPALGQELYERYGCSGCHVAHRLSVRRGEVGPTLYDFPNRVMIAGRLGNNEANLIRWITNPQAVAPGSGMPNLNVNPEEARHIAAYIYTLGVTPE